MKYLDLTGLSEVWANIKSYISSKIPTKTSQLQNDSNYVTTSQLPSKTSQLTNDSDFTTNAKLATKQDTISDLATIRNGASKGATAVQPIELSNYATKSELSDKANDSDVVHKSGNETVNGVKNFNSVFLGEQGGVIRIGDNGQGKLFCKLFYDGGIYNNSTQFVPNTNNEYNLGTSTKKWKDVYASTLYGSLVGDVTGNLTGNVTGNADTATHISYQSSSDNTIANTYCGNFWSDGRSVFGTGWGGWYSAFNSANQDFGSQIFVSENSDRMFFRRLYNSKWYAPLEVIHSANIGSQSVNYANSAGAVAWNNVSGRPTKLSQFTNDSGYITSGDVVDRTSNQSINGDKTFNKLIQTDSGLWTKDNICLRIQNIDNNETNPTQEIGTCAIGFTNKDASAWWAYNRYIRTTADGTAYLNLLCHPIKKSDGSYTVGGYINIYNTGFARVNDPLKIDPNTTWNNNNIVTSNWVRKYFSNSIGNYWSKSATGHQYSRSTFSYLSTIDKATTNTSWSMCRPFRIVDKDNSIELGYVEYGYKSDLAYTRLTTHHSNGRWLDFTIHSNGVSYFDNCSELWLVNRNLISYNTTPSNEEDTQIWFMDRNSNKYATLQTDYFPNGVRQFALTHKSLKTNNWIGLNIKTSPTDDVIVSQPRFQAQNNLIVQNTNPNAFTEINQGWIEMSFPGYCYIDFKHEGSQDYLGRIALSPANILYLETINGAPIMANGKNIVRSVNGVNADSNGNVNIQGLSNGIGEIIQGYYVPNGIVQKSGSVYFGTLVQPNPGATLNDFRDINITITNEFYPEVGKIYDYSQIFSTLYLHSYDSEYAVGATFDSGSPKIDKWFGGWAKVAGRNLVRNSGKYLCTSVSSYGYTVTLRYNLTMTCTTTSHPGGSHFTYTCKIVSKTVPQNQMTVTSKATFMRVG